MTSKRLANRSVPHQMWRLFVAVSLPEPVREWLTELQQDLKQHDMPVRWVASANIHLTLTFLGDTAPHKVQSIEEALVTAVLGCRLMELQAAGLGVFPSLNNPRVLWAGLKGDIYALAALKKAVDFALSELGLDLEIDVGRSFRPHLTLGRFRPKIAPKKLVDVIRELGQKQPISFQVDRFHLFKSTLKPQGAVYTSLRTVILAS